MTRRRRSSTLAAAALLLSLSAAGAARADEVSPRQKDAAEKLFTEGREALARGEDELACAKFKSSVVLFAVPNALANVARCAERDGQTLEALQAWERVIAMLPAGDPRLAVARERVAALGANAAWLELVVPAPLPAGARVLLDGEPVPAGPGSALPPLRPGEHTIVVEAPGRDARRIVLTLAGGDRREVAVSAGPSLAPPPPPPEATGDGRRTAGFVVGGVGVAGLVAAGITGGVLLGRDARIRELCPDHVCTKEGTDEIAGSKPLLIVNGVAWGVGLAGVGVGAYLLLSGHAHEPPSVGFSPVLLPGGAGASFGETF